jgi:molybdopterin-guanine dinucleotide biosynthesis protein A
VTAVTGLILAGGRSRRMGRPKATICIDGVTLIERVAKVLGEFCDPVLVVGDDPILPEGLGLKVVEDAAPGGTVVRGLLGGLRASPHDLAAAVGCDMPYLKSSLLKRQVEHAIDYDVVLLASARGLEPLHGVYRRSVIPALESLATDPTAGLRDLWSRVRGLVLEEGEVRDLDPDAKSTVNLNTPEDLLRYTGSGQG